eukprot:CAMPEP_0194027736 /NCGR_PEP_ID=MMETSP0009_2-20130614/1818_1 /TAXON_ID=210454 /ORGANISM="Grammatophora oceanica, Strain CCMP 410" /LENGTH=394 /DNA_ID=CAMNT_0038666893 /DNA_START=53 /DNA_END=1237 /DNA_ORIENTATION=-
MKFLLAALFAATASAWRVDSPMGSKLMASATLKEQHRSLNQNEERDVSFIANMSIKFSSCHSLLQVNGEEGGGGDGEGRLYTQNLVEFMLCPADTCTYGSKFCKGGAQYVVDMRTFVTLYVQMKQEELEQACQVVAENCYCDNANDDQACENQCYIDNGLEDCVEWNDDQNGGQEEEDIERYMECQAVEGNNNNNNNNNNWNYNNGDGAYYGELFVGPMCSSNGKSILLAAFYDEACSVPADSGIYESQNYGASLPYSTESLIKPDCISCEQVDQDQNNNNNNNNNGNNNNNNNNGDVELKELCEQTYELAGRCESNLNIAYPDETGCNYINNILPKMEGATKSLSSGSGGKAAVVCAWVFGILTAILGVYAFLLYRRLKRSKVALNEDSSPQV